MRLEQALLCNVVGNEHRWQSCKSYIYLKADVAQLLIAVVNALTLSFITRTLASIYICNHTLMNNTKPAIIHSPLAAIFFYRNAISGIAVDIPQ